MREKKINSVLQQFCICVGFLQILLAAENPPMIEDAFFFWLIIYYILQCFFLSLDKVCVKSSVSVTRKQSLPYLSLWVLCRLKVQTLILTNVAWTSREIKTKCYLSCQKNSFKNYSQILIIMKKNLKSDSKQMANSKVDTILVSSGKAIPQTSLCVPVHMHGIDLYSCSYSQKFLMVTSLIQSSPL